MNIRAGSEPKVNSDGMAEEEEDKDDEEDNPCIFVAFDDEDSDRSLSSGIGNGDDKNVPNSIAGASRNSTMAGGSTVASRKKARKNSFSPGGGDNDATAIVKASAEAASLKVAEERRHNKAMEAIDASKYAWSSKQTELSYRMSLLEEYDKLKERKWSDRRIVRFHADMKDIVEENSTDNEEE